jgi:hypothetical protein
VLAVEIYIDMTENEESVFAPSDDEIFTTIWISPRKIFKYIHESHHDKYVVTLLLLSGISRAFDRAALNDMGDSNSLTAIIVLCIIAGGLFGWMTYYIYAAMLSWTGSWLGGKGNTKSILRILAYGMLPSVVALIFLIPQLVIYGDEVFKSEGDITSGGLLANVIVYGSMAIEFVLGIWTMVLCVVGISEVQKLNVGKSILNLLLPAIVIIVPIFIIILISR